MINPSLTAWTGRKSTESGMGALIGIGFFCAFLLLSVAALAADNTTDVNVTDTVTPDITAVMTTPPMEVTTLSTPAPLETTATPGDTIPGQPMYPPH